MNSYLPSNGTEGIIFMDGWCRKCARDKAMREGADFDECDDNELCPIIAAAFRGPVAEWVADENGPKCTAFVPAGDPVPPPRCGRTADMFSLTPNNTFGDTRTDE